MKAILTLITIIYAISAQAEDTKCGLYRITGQMSNGKARVLTVHAGTIKQKDFFLHETCPAIDDGIVAGQFQLTSLSPLIIKCTEKSYTIAGPGKRLQTVKMLKAKQCEVKKI